MTSEYTKFEYIVVTKDSQDTFVKEVNEKLNDGWVISGSLSTCYRSDSYILTYSQALLKKTNI